MSDEPHEPDTTPASTPPPPKPIALPVTLAVCAAGWLAPGLAHIALGRWVRGLILAFAILTMFGMGIAMHGRLYDLSPEQPLQVFAFLANVGAGLPYMLAQRLGYGVGQLSSPNYDYGNTYLWVSGLLNYLIVLDAFDIAQGRKP